MLRAAIAVVSERVVVLVRRFASLWAVRGSRRLHSRGESAKVELALEAVE